MTVAPPFDPTKRPSNKWDMVTVKWLGRTLSGDVSGGDLTISVDRTQSMFYDDPESPVTVLPADITAPLTTVNLVDGAELREYMFVAVHVPASDDPDITGSGFTYTASIRFRNGLLYGPYTFTVPWDTPGGVLWLNRVAAATQTPGEALPQITLAEFRMALDRITAIEFGGGGGGGGGNDPNAVKLTGDQTVAGVKTFTSSPSVPNGSFTVSKTTGLQGVLDGKAPAANPVFSGVVAGVTKTHVGLGSVDDTADTAKTFTGAQITSGVVPAARLGTGTANAGAVLFGDGAWKTAPTGGGEDPTAVKLTGDQTVAGVKTFSSAPVVPDSSFPQAKVTGLVTGLAGKAPLASPTFTGTVTGVTKTHVGLGNVDNIADTAKAFTAAQTTSGVFANARLGSGTAAAGKYVDGGTGAWTTLPAVGGGGTLADLPAGAVIYTNTTTRPSARTDLMCIFTGLDPGANALTNDMWIGS